MSVGRFTTFANGVIKPTGKELKKGKLELRGRFVQAYNGDPEVEIEYPYEYVRSHPLTRKGEWVKPAHLIDRMVALLRSKYGVNEIQFTSVPDILPVPQAVDEAGKLKKETTYGPWMTFKAEVK